MALVGIVVIAAAIGGATTSVVRASIPDGNGTIHSCYSTARGSMYIIDSASQSCGTGETGLNWNQTGGKPIHDADGQFLGNLLVVPGTSAGSWAIYNPTLNRVMLVYYSSGGGSLTIVSPSSVGTYFESNDCTGQAYATDNSTGDVKTHLIRVGSSSYGIVQDNTSTETKTISSSRHYDADADSFSCDSDTDFTGSVYEISSASLPFTAPIERPLKF